MFCTRIAGAPSDLKRAGSASDPVHSNAWVPFGLLEPAGVAVVAALLVAPHLDYAEHAAHLDRAVRPVAAHADERHVELGLREPEVTQRLDVRVDACNLRARVGEQLEHADQRTCDRALTAVSAARSTACM